MALQQALPARLAHVYDEDYEHCNIRCAAAPTVHAMTNKLWICRGTLLCTMHTHMYVLTSQSRYYADAKREGRVARIADCERAALGDEWLDVPTV